MFLWFRAPSGGRRPPQPRLRWGRPGRTDRHLVAALAGIPQLNQLAVRHELLLLMGELLGTGRPFDVPESAHAPTHLRAIVRTARRTGTLATLRDAVRDIQLDDIGAEWFELLVTILTTPSGPLPAAGMLDLAAELRRQPPGFGQQALNRYAAERRAAGRPLDARTLPQTLLRLYDARVPVTDLDAPRSRLLHFLRLLAQEAQEWQEAPVPLTPELARVLASVVGREDSTADHATPTAAERQVIIQIRVEEEGAPTDLPYTQRQYSLRGYYYERVGDARPAYLGSRSLPDRFTGDQLESRGRAFLAAWQEPVQAARGVSKRVEFLLPHSLLGHPAELWPGGAAHVPISHTCQVVVRSLTRYKDSSVHDEWLRRWKALDRDNAPGDALDRIGWMSPVALEEDALGADSAERNWSCPVGRYPPLRLTSLDDVANWLAAHADLSCLGLGTPYDHDNGLLRDAVRDALLLDGIPVMVWRREEADPGPMLDVLRDPRPPAVLADLPDSVHQARRRAPRGRQSVHNQITLLWDDPTCVFSGQDQQMSGTRGAGEGAT